jgi:hypothetical protein
MSKDGLLPEHDSYKCLVVTTLTITRDVMSSNDKKASAQFMVIKWSEPIVGAYDSFRRPLQIHGLRVAYIRCRGIWTTTASLARG